MLIENSTGNACNNPLNALNIVHPYSLMHYLNNKNPSYILTLELIVLPYHPLKSHFFPFVIGREKKWSSVNSKCQETGYICPIRWDMETCIRTLILAFDLYMYIIHQYWASSFGCGRRHSIGRGRRWIYIKNQSITFLVVNKWLFICRLRHCLVSN